MATKRSEVAWGTAQELEIAEAACEYLISQGEFEIVKLGQFADADFLVTTRDGYPRFFLEVKSRRVTYGTFGDVMVPWRKHLFALNALEDYNINTYAVTRYSCGTLVVCSLSDTPTAKQNVKRKDRNVTLPHALYSGRNVRVLNAS